MSDEQNNQYVNPAWLRLPHTTTHEWSITPQTVNEPRYSNRAAETMETTGFMILQCATEPSEAETAKVIDAFELASLRGLTGSGGPTTHCKGGRESNDYLRSGLEARWIENLVERELHEEYDWIHEQDPIILRGKDGAMDNDIRTAHPSENAISIIRVVTGEINPAHGQVRLFGMSHHGTLDLGSAVARRLTNRHLLVMKGPLKWNIRPSQETVLIWKGFSERPMQHDVLSPSAYPFMTFTVPLSLDGAFPEHWMATPRNPA